MTTIVSLVQDGQAWIAGDSRVVDDGAPVTKLDEAKRCGGPARSCSAVVATLVRSKRCITDYRCCHQR